MRIGQEVKFTAESGQGDGTIIDIMYEGNVIIAVFVKDGPGAMHKASSIMDKAQVKLWEQKEKRYATGY